MYNIYIFIFLVFYIKEVIKDTDSEKSINA